MNAIIGKGDHFDECPCVASCHGRDGVCGTHDFLRCPECVCPSAQEVVRMIRGEAGKLVGGGGANSQMIGRYLYDLERRIRSKMGASPTE